MAVSSYLRPDENWALGGAVADSAGATDSDYVNEWLCDGRSGRPAKATNGTVTWTISNSSGYVDLIVVANHNIDAGDTITIGGSISTTLTSPAVRPNLIPYNPFAIVTPNAAVTTLSVAISGNSATVVIGEVLAGKLRTFPHGDLLNADLTDAQDDLRRQHQSSFGSVPPYDARQASRPLTGSVVCTTADLDDLMAWYESQRNGVYPSVIILNSAVNDARVVHLDKPQARRQATRWITALTFLEYPRSRW